MIGTAPSAEALHQARLRTYHLGIGVGFGLMVAGVITGSVWFFDLQPEKNPISLAVVGAVIFAVSAMNFFMPLPHRTAEFRSKP